MLNKDKKLKKNAAKAQDEVKQAKGAQDDVMQELGDDVLDTISGAGDPFANRPRVSTKNINSSVRNNG